MPGVVPAVGAPAVAAAPVLTGPATPWTQHTAPDGRAYYYNTITKQSSWEKPEELKTPAEVFKEGPL